MKKATFNFMVRFLICLLCLPAFTAIYPAAAEDIGFMTREKREMSRERESKEFQERFEWWPTDATPAPVEDEKRGGYWWWPDDPGTVGPLWGNRGYVYVRKIIYDYKADELPPPKPKELRPSLLIKKEIKNVKIYFDYDRADLRADHIPILEDAIGSLKKNPKADILITGNCDIRGSEAYNERLGKARGEAVKDFMIEKGIPDSRIRIISKGKLDAVAPITDLVGMQKDRNAQFMIAEVEEVMIPHMGGKSVEKLEARPIGEGRYLSEEEVGVESAIKVSTTRYVVQEGDTLKKIAAEQLGGIHRWQYLYEFNKDRINDPDLLQPGTVLVIPIEQEGQGKSAKATAVSPQAPRPRISSEEQAPKETYTYTIMKNDSLWKIAKKQLGDGNRWKEIYELNKSKIKNPDSLTPGAEILIPAR
ncbi:MAG: LysM peptidoglycan-binding domain-containing protein [Candidatus Omnitrophica bacterium]|nr:LysM peptidoglycan-binding domain-containing protein [Candidatus Omnitrophota bacterium]